MHNNQIQPCFGSKTKKGCFLSQTVKVRYFLSQNFEICAISRKNVWKCAERRLHTFFQSVSRWTKEVHKSSWKVFLGLAWKWAFFLLGVPWLGQKFCINPNQSVRSKIRNIPSMLFHFQFWINVVANAGCLLCQANSAQLAKCEWSLALRGCVSRGASPPPHLTHTAPSSPTHLQSPWPPRHCNGNPDQQS